MKGTFESLAARIDTLSLRERAFIFVGLLGSLYAVWEIGLFSPLDARRTALVASVERLGSEIEVLNVKASQIAAARIADPDREDRERLAAMRAETTELAATLERVTSSLVPPREMSRLLEAVLTRETHLSLVRLEGLGTQAVLVPEAGEKGASAASEAEAPADGPVLYKHGLRIEFEGGYLDTLDYLVALEALSWGFLWDSVRIEIEEYPTARVAIVVYSLSLDDAWIGV